VCDGFATALIQIFDHDHFLSEIAVEPGGAWIGEHIRFLVEVCDGPVACRSGLTTIGWTLQPKAADTAALVWGEGVELILLLGFLKPSVAREEVLIAFLFYNLCEIVSGHKTTTEDGLLLLACGHLFEEVARELGWRLILLGKVDEDSERIFSYLVVAMIGLLVFSLKVEGCACARRIPVGKRDVSM